MRKINNPNKSPFIFTVSEMYIIALCLVISDVISEKFGTYPHYSTGSFSRMELGGIIIPLIVLIIPVFAEKYRENLWSGKNIITIFIVLIISSVLITITYANKEFYWGAWFESGPWERDNCPPVRWDIWNIIPAGI